MSQDIAKRTLFLQGKRLQWLLWTAKKDHDVSSDHFASFPFANPNGYGMLWINSYKYRPGWMNIHESLRWSGLDEPLSFLSVAESFPKEMEVMGKSTINQLSMVEFLDVTGKSTKNGGFPLPPWREPLDLGSFSPSLSCKTPSRRNPIFNGI